MRTVFTVSLLKSKRMHFLFLSDYFSPIIKSGAIIVEDLANEFVKQGHEITVVTFADNIKKINKTEYSESIELIRIPTRLRGKGKAGRLVDEILYSRKIKSLLKKGDYIKEIDAIVCYSPSIFYGKAIKALKAQFDLKAYLIIRDIFPKWAVDSGILRKGILYKFFKRIEKELYDSCDYIGIESKQDLPYFEEIVNDKKINVLSNWASETVEFSQNEPEILSKNKNVKILYGGNIGDAQDLFSLINKIDTIKSLSGGDIYILGEGNQKNKIEDLLVKNNITNIHLLGEVSRDHYLEFLNHCDIGLVCLNKDLKSNNFPLKMMGYIQLGKPLLASVNKDNEIIDLINKQEIGRVSLSEDMASFNEGLEEMIKNEEMRKRCGLNARKLFKERFTVSIAANQITSHFFLSG